MRTIKAGTAILAAALFLFIGFATPEANGQERSVHKTGSGEFCSNNYYSSGDRAGFSEIRELSMPASGSLSVDAGKNGGISVKGGDVSAIQIKACINAWSTTEDAAKSIVGNIRIDTGGTVKAVGVPEDSPWGVSYLITVPRNTDLQLTAKNGGIAISGVNGDLEFTTVNGGVSLKNVAGSVKGTTTNGGVNIALSGSSWNGTGLDVTTTNGGVNLTIPQNFAANIETGTVNGGFKSDIPELNVTTENVVGGGWGGRSRAKQINTSINGGGAPIKVRTTNGGVKISTTEVNL